MPRRPTLDEYASIRLTHNQITADRKEQLRRRPGRRSSQPECLVIGHSWTEDASRHGGTICMVCQVVRFP